MEAVAVAEGDNMSADAPAGQRPSLTRAAILDQASEILSSEGVHALSMRRLSRSVGASTIVLYTHFTDKHDILNELYVEGFRRLLQELESVTPDADPLGYVADLGRAYHRSAIANPSYYQIMFSDCVKGFTPPPDSLAWSRRCFTVLQSAVEGCETAQILPRGAATPTAQVLWGTLHGLISLELLGHWGDAAAGEARIEDAMAILQSGLTRSPATDRDPDPISR